MRDLRVCVYAAVGSPGTVELNGLTRDRFCGLVQTLLNRDAVFLHLPADVVCPVVLNDYTDAAAHSGSFSIRMMPTRNKTSSRVEIRSRA